MAPKTLPIKDALSALAAEWGRRGGNARREKTTAEERSRIAKLAAKARWAKKASPDGPEGGPDNDQRPIRTGILLSARRRPVHSTISDRPATLAAAA